jgi:hypothetical protein
VSVGALELRVDVDEGLYPVVAGGNVRHVEDGSSQVGAVDDGGRAGQEVLDVASEERRPDATDQRARLTRAVGAEDRIDAPRERLASHGGGNAYLELCACATRRTGKDHRRLREAFGGQRDDRQKTEGERAMCGQRHGRRSRQERGSQHP